MPTLLGRRRGVAWRTHQPRACRKSRRAANRMGVLTGSHFSIATRRERQTASVRWRVAATRRKAGGACGKAPLGARLRSPDRTGLSRPDLLSDLNIFRLAILLRQAGADDASIAFSCSSVLAQATSASLDAARRSQRVATPPPPRKGS